MRFSKGILLLCIATIFLLPASLVHASDKSPFPVLSVDGTGSTQVAPDQASVMIGITTHAENAQEAQNKNASIASNIQDALRSMGISEKCIQTRNYTFQPTFSTEKDHENEYDGYTVSNTIKVVLNDTSLVGQVVDKALANGANRINSLDFSARNTQKPRKEALLAAINDAREKADIIAAGLGKTIIGVQNISENSSMQIHNYDNVMFSKAALSANTPIAPGSLEYSATVHIDFILNN